MKQSPQLEVIQGTQVVYPIRLKYKTTGAPVDLTGATVILSAKANMADDDDDAYLRISQTSHTDAAGGETSITIPSDDLDTVGRYYYDVAVYFPSAPVKTFHGILIVHPAVTQSNP